MLDDSKVEREDKLSEMDEDEADMATLNVGRGQGRDLDSCAPDHAEKGRVDQPHVSADFA
ncbi:hypothetical protein PMN64_32440 [Bradyrhizobium sp. UFLA01-814]|uniref:hypothetical protein n=1 Tax=Bradyrhizobium sp. UFLA01-814 TaxID=3023480 RepID=UPI00398A8C8C